MGQMKYYRGSKDISGTRRTVREWNWYYDESPAVRAMKKLAMFAAGFVAVGAISLVVLGGFAQEADGRDVEPEWTWKVHPSDITNKAAMNRIWSSRIDEFVNSKKICVQLFQFIICFILGDFRCPGRTCMFVSVKKIG